MSPCVWCEAAPCRCDEIERDVAALEALFMLGVAGRAKQNGEDATRWQSRGDQAADHAIRVDRRISRGGK